MRQWTGIALLTGLMLSGPTRGANGQTAVDTAKAVQAATTAAEVWLGLIDAGNYGASWDSAATAFQSAVSRLVWEQAVVRARGPLKPFGRRAKPTATYTTQLPNAPAGQYVVLQYQTAVSQGRTVTETVTPMWDGSRGWRVSGYFVRPQ